MSRLENIIGKAEVCFEYIQQAGNLTKEELMILLAAAKNWHAYELRCQERAMKENNND